MIATAKSYFAVASATALLTLKSQASASTAAPHPPTTAAFTLPPLPFLTARTSPSNPALTEYASQQQSAQIHLRLDIGRTHETSRLPIDNLVLELLAKSSEKDATDGATTTTTTTPLPGADGPNPGLSSGRHSLTMVQSGQYITLDGTQNVPLTCPAWEIVWRYGSPAGSVVFGFEVAEEVKRNDAMLPRGRMYVSFPVWTREGMEEARKHVGEVRRLANQYEDERDGAIQSAKETANPLMKALHFREAFAAQERLDYSGVKSLGVVPGTEDVIKIGGELLLVRRGLVWTKDGTTFAFGGDHSLLGHATVSGVKLGREQVVGGSSDELRP